MTSYLWKFWGIRISPPLPTTSKGSVEVFDWLLLVYDELVRTYMLYENHCKQGKQLKAVVDFVEMACSPPCLYSSFATRYMLKRFFTLPQPRVVGLSMSVSEAKWQKSKDIPSTEKA